MKNKYAECEHFYIRDVLDGKCAATPYDPDIYAQIRRRWDRVAKPLDGMGRFEPLLAQIGAVQGTADVRTQQARLLVFCADNGVVAEGISQSEQSVTAVCAANIAVGRTAVGRMTALAGCHLEVIDIGLNTELPIPGVRDCRVLSGTANFYRQAAMSADEAERALQRGMDILETCRWVGDDIVCLGEMGIGNTTTGSAVAAALLKMAPKDVTGRGAGLDDERLRHKIEIIRETIDARRLYEADAFTVLCQVGGLDIAGMAGVCIGAALYHIPVVLDGMISTVAALVAERLLPGVRNYLVPSHLSREPAAVSMMSELGLHPVIDAKMALGEGTGAVLMLPLLRMAEAVYRETNSFEAAGVEQYRRF